MLTFAAIGGAAALLAGLVSGGEAKRAESSTAEVRPALTAPAASVSVAASTAAAAATTSADQPAAAPEPVASTPKPAPKPKAKPKPAEKPAANRTATPAVQRFSIAIGAGGYVPSSIRASSSAPIRLTVAKGEGCAAGFNIPELGIEADNSAGRVTLNLGKVEKGSYVYTCSMGMVSGTLVVR